jgi:PleD family two-component response regulator
MQSNQLVDKESLGGVRVLVVDDDLDTLEMVRVILQNRGAEVDIASSAATRSKLSNTRCRMHLCRISPCRSRMGSN